MSNIDYSDVPPSAIIFGLTKYVMVCTRVLMALWCRVLAPAGVAGVMEGEEVIGKCTML